MEIEPLAFSSAEAARALGVSIDTVKRLVREGEIESFTIGSSRRIARQALGDFIARRHEANRR
jgi:excisionase family DNA binding protein